MPELFMPGNHNPYFRNLTYICTAGILSKIMHTFKYSVLACLSLGLANHSLQAQGDAPTRVVTTSVPFLVIGPDARAGGMADQGVSTSADANSLHWNVAKLAFVEKPMGLSVSYTPWLRNLVPDINLAYVGFYGKINDRFTVAASLRYFNMGDINFTDEIGMFMGTFTPNELAIDAGGSLLLSEHWSMGISFKFISSNLTLGQQVNGQPTEPGLAGAGDLGFYFQKPGRKIGGFPMVYRFGTAIQNIGSKIDYGDPSGPEWIPVNFRLGGGAEMKIDDYNRISLNLEVSKLLVPTPPIFNSTGDSILAGQDRDRPVLTGMFTSLGDAPGTGIYGSVFEEEMDEFVWSIAAEYWYGNVLAVRSGFFYESPRKGNRQYITLGAGLRYKVFGLDFAYVLPVGGRTNPLSNTLRFTLSFDFAKGFGKN
jgi:hypothetical protein